ncbi:hypothetical protein MKY37_04415 [Psychrobacillus sp. FSL K6-2836]|uniref:hypothetical protein n=1 Tax=Psychrobacillus sp. FSL K6-2836 TaxID=2921548 RepID=UPI0030F715E1
MLASTTFTNPYKNHTSKYDLLLQEYYFTFLKESKAAKNGKISLSARKTLFLTQVNKMRAQVSCKVMKINANLVQATNLSKKVNRYKHGFSSCTCVIAGFLLFQHPLEKKKRGIS